MTTDTAARDQASGAEAAPAPISLGAATALWMKIGLMSFGGPAGQIELMHNAFVDKRRALANDAFQRGLSFSMLLPGPEAQQLATWIGWRLHGMVGGLIAGFLFVAPGAALMIALAFAAAAYGALPWLQALFGAVAPVVVVIVLQALWKISNRALGGPADYALAIAAFVAIYVLGAPFPLIVLAAAVIGLFLPRAAPATSAPSEASSASGSAGLWARAGVIVAVSAALVVGVYFAVRGLYGAEPFDEVAELFVTAAFVTFGGAYAVLPYVAGQSVETYGWLTQAEMVNGLALAESTPGPLILVNVYAGWFAGWNGPGDAGVATLTAALACFYTFAPSFMLILAAAPIVERVSDIAWARRALAGVSAAVVGVIANLVPYVGEAALIPTAGMIPSPELFMGPYGVDFLRVGIAVAAAIGAFVFRLSMLTLIALGAAAGLALHFGGVWV